MRYGIETRSRSAGQYDSFSFLHLYSTSIGIDLTTSILDGDPVFVGAAHD